MLFEPLGYAAIPTYPDRYNSDLPQTYCNEVRISNLLHHEAVGVVAFVGAYSTDAHPLALVYEYMDGLDLKQYLKNEPYVRRLKLVHVPLRTFSTNRLTLPDNSSPIYPRT